MKSNSEGSRERGEGHGSWGPIQLQNSMRGREDLGINTGYILSGPIYNPALVHKRPDMQPCTWFTRGLICNPVPGTQEA